LSQSAHSANSTPKHNNAGNAVKIFIKFLGISALMLSLMTLCILYYTRDQLLSTVKNNDTIIMFSPYLGQDCFAGYLSMNKDVFHVSYEAVTYPLLPGSLGNFAIDGLENFMFLPIENKFGWFSISRQINESLYFVVYINNEFVLSLSPLENQGFFVGSVLLKDVYRSFQC
jgi:hypothetical protein